MRLARTGLAAGLLLMALGGCGHLGAAATDAQWITNPDWRVVNAVPLVRQESEADCGAAALAMALGHWDRPMTVDQIVARYPPQPGRGIHAGSLRDLARSVGLSAFLISGTVRDLDTEIERNRPVLVGLIKRSGRVWFSHYEVVVGLSRDGRRILLVDPDHGWHSADIDDFETEWARSQRLALVMLPPDGNAPSIHLNGAALSSLGR